VTSIVTHASGLADDLTWLSRPADAGPLVGWGCGELMPGGLPWLMRMDFDHPREELTLRAFLGQPLICCGHHEILAGGPEALEQLAADVNRVGDVRWSSLAGIARAAFETARRGQILAVRMLGRRITIDVPAGVEEVQIDASAVAPSAARRIVRLSPPDPPVIIGTGAEVVLRGLRPGQLELMVDGAVDPAGVAPPRGRAFPVVRRLLAEGRDRSRPLAPTVRRAQRDVERPR